MNENKEYAYYVVELSYPVHRNEKFLCVPASWIHAVIDYIAVVQYPRCEPEMMESRQIDPYEVNPLDWMMLVTEVKHKSNSYKHVINYTKFLNTKAIQRLNQIQEAKKSQEQTVKDNELLISVENSTKCTQNLLLNFEKQNETFESPTADHPTLLDSNINENQSCEEENWQSGIANSSITSPNNSTVQTNSLHQLSEEQHLQYTSATNHQNTITRNIYDESSDFISDYIEKCIKYKRDKKIKTNNDSDYYYTPELTDTPLKLKIIRKPTSPRIKMTEQPPLTNPNMDNIKKQAATAENDLITLENSCQELRKHLTKTMHDLSLGEHLQNTQMPGMNKENSKQNSEWSENNKSVHYNLSGLTSESTCDHNILLEFTKINSRLDELFLSMYQNRCDITKVNSKFENMAKERDCFDIQPNDSFSSKTVATEVGEYVISNETVRHKRASSNELVKRKRNKSEGDQLEDIPKKKFISNSTMPPEYDQYNSRWTLRYQKMDKGLIELMEKSDIYVNEANLLNYKRLAKSSRQLARMLLLEIFNLNALYACTLTGTRGRPGLDKTATYYMLVYVEICAREKNWAILCTDQEIANHRYHVMMSLRTKIVNMRRRKYY